MGPDDRLARLLSALDRLPVRSRRMLAALIPMALVGLLIGGFALARHGPHHAAAERPAASGQHASGPPPRKRQAGTPARAGPQPAGAALGVARGFVESYLAYSYGRAGLRRIRGADRHLVRLLARARVPAAMRGRRARVTALQVTAVSPGVARASATVADGAGARYPLVFFLDRRAGRWLVTRMAD